mgnify:CR=1 FL=1
MPPFESDSHTIDDAAQVTKNTTDIATKAAKNGSATESFQTSQLKVSNSAGDTVNATLFDLAGTNFANPASISKGVFLSETPAGAASGYVGGRKQSGDWSISK